MVHQVRCGVDDVLHRRILAVKDPQWVPVHAPAGVFIQLIRMGFQMSNQSRAVEFALLAAAKGIDFEPYAREPEQIPEALAHQQHFSVDVRSRVSQRFRSDLVKLPVPALLRPFVPEHRPHVINPLRSTIEQAVLQRRPDRRCRCLGPQGELFTVEAVFEAIHLLFDDIRRLANGPAKQ